VKGLASRHCDASIVNWSVIEIYKNVSDLENQIMTVATGAGGSLIIVAYSYNANACTSPSSTKTNKP
jgi:hypothetical protein